MSKAATVTAVCRLTESLKILFQLKDDINALDALSPESPTKDDIRLAIGDKYMAFCKLVEYEVDDDDNS